MSGWLPCLVNMLATLACNIIATFINVVTFIDIVDSPCECVAFHPKNLKMSKSA